jgi:enoyl-CoA hydratase/carnithine racemase
MDIYMQNDEPELATELKGHVATVEIRRPPHNFFDRALIVALAETLERLDQDKACRAIVLASLGKSFCAGSDLSKREDLSKQPNEKGPHIYKEAVRLFCTRKPIVAAIQGAAVGGGLGLALIADFRVTCAEAHFTSNFSQLGYHPGFGLTATLPRLIGQQAASLLFYTSRRIYGQEAIRMGLADILVARDDVRKEAESLACDIARCAPLAVQSTRQTIRRGLIDALGLATEREFMEQDWLRRTADFREGVKAVAERRDAAFCGE